MQHEFNNRIAAQRAVLQILNARARGPEDLFGLSSKAIDRWISVNSLDPSSRLVRIVKDVSGKLFFLANKSQEQITEEYKAVSDDIAAMCDALRNEVGVA